MRRAHDARVGSWMCGRARRARPQVAGPPLSTCRPARAAGECAQHTRVRPTMSRRRLRGCREPSPPTPCRQRHGGALKPPKEGQRLVQRINRMAIAASARAPRSRALHSEAVRDLVERDHRGGSGLGRRSSGIRPRHPALKIGVPQKLLRELLVRNGDQCYLQTCDATVFHRRNAIRIRCDQDDAIDGFRVAERGDIEADPHIDPFLLKVRLEVAIGQARWRDRHSPRLEPSKLENTTPDREEILSRKLPEPSVGAVELVRLSRDREFGFADERCTVIVKDT